MERLCKALHQPELVSGAKRKYDTTFGSEQKLNKEFRMFVQNYQRAFEQNLSRKESKSLIEVSKHSQCKNRVKHSSFNFFLNANHIEYFGAGVILPQGPSFSSLVEHFSSIAKKETRLCPVESVQSLITLLE